MTSARFVIVPLGSAGDVNPLLWLGRLLADRGHDVVVVIQAGMIDYAQRAGLRAVPAGSADEQETLMRDPDVWHPRRAFGVLARKFPRWGEEMAPLVRTQVVPGRTVIIGAGIAFGARMAAECDQVPLVTTHLQPCIFMSPHEMPVLMAGMEHLKGRPLWLRKFFLRLGYWETERVLRGPVNRARRRMGLTTPAKGILSRWALSPDLVLALFPEWFGPRQPDWPAQTVATRFPLNDEAGSRPLSPELERFFSAGEPPVLLTPGSANLHARKFLVQGAEACWKLGRRALIVTPFKENLPATLPAGCAHFDFAPFGPAFRRCALVMHHGGIGTSAQALAGGVPQMIMPMAHDQPDNAWRLRQLGVGDYLYPGRWEADRIAARAGTLLRAEGTGPACARARQLVEEQMPAAAVAEILERLARKRLGG
jgi:UDP:flavonoid glycosyltransferase YjiC (YdhE family)